MVASYNTNSTCTIKWYEHSLIDATQATKFFPNEKWLATRLAKRLSIRKAVSREKCSDKLALGSVEQENCNGIGKSIFITEYD